VTTLTTATILAAIDGLDLAWTPGPVWATLLYVEADGSLQTYARPLHDKSLPVRLAYSNGCAILLHIPQTLCGGDVRAWLKDEVDALVERLPPVVAALAAGLPQDALTAHERDSAIYDLQHYLDEGLQDAHTAGRFREYWPAGDYLIDPVDPGVTAAAVVAEAIENGVLLDLDEVRAYLDDERARRAHREEG
jgi:hypothetical protein